MSEMNKEGLEARFARVRLRTSKALDERVKATLAEAGADVGAKEPSMKGRTVMFHILKTARGKLSLAAAGIAIAVGLAFYLFGSRTVAFADVLEKVRAARTVKYKMTMQVTGALPAEMLSKAVQTCDVMIMEPGKMRMMLPDGSVMVFDSSRKESLALNPVKHKALVITASQKPPSQGSVQFIDMLKNLQDGSQEKLGKREIDGKTATGFHVIKGLVDWTIWANGQTRLPIQVEIKSSMLGMPQVIVLSDFVFDEPMDESLFSLTPPSGYTVERQQVDASLPREEDLISGLREVTRMTSGLFPDEFSMLSVIKVADEQKERGLKPDMGGRTPEEATKYAAKEGMMKLMRGILFVGAMKPENDWHYAGGGVKAGDASKAVCWWRPDGATTYRAVYGDFSVKDVNPSDLPTVSGK